MRISDWSSDVCSSDLAEHLTAAAGKQLFAIQRRRSRHRSVPIRERANYVSSAVKPRRRSATARPRAGRVLIRIKHARTHPFTLRSLRPDRKTVVSGKRVSVRVDLGGRRIITIINAESEQPVAWTYAMRQPPQVIESKI